MGRAIFAAVLVFGASCTSNNGNGSNGPICSPTSFQLDGTVGGTMIAVTATTANYAFVNALGSNMPGSLDVTYNGMGHVHLTWSTLVADDRSTSATGTLVVAGTVSTDYCVSGATLTPRTNAEGGGASFVLDGLATGNCPGVAVAGSLSGCAAPAMP